MHVQRYVLYIVSYIIYYIKDRIVYHWWTHEPMCRAQLQQAKKVYMNSDFSYTY